MKGFLANHEIASILEHKASGLRQMERYDWSVSDITDWLESLAAELVRKAETDPYETAKAVLREDGFKLTGFKILAIKEVRMRTGSGLKEAKDAVEQALPQVLSEQAEKALEALAKANAVAPYGYKVRIPAGWHAEAIAEGEPPF